MNFAGPASYDCLTSMINFIYLAANRHYSPYSATSGISAVPDYQRPSCISSEAELATDC